MDETLENQLADFIDYDIMDLTLEEELDLLKDDYIVEETEEPTQVDLIRYPRGGFLIDNYQAPQMTRDQYIQMVNYEAKQTHYDRYKPIDLADFIHIDRALSLNLYVPEMERVLAILKDYYGQGKLYITNGFRSPFEEDLNAHHIGMAVDIKASSMEQAKRIAGAAYLAGFPTILFVGDLENNQGHVHLDLAPKADYLYDNQAYNGPWS